MLFWVWHKKCTWRRRQPPIKAVSVVATRPRQWFYWFNETVNLLVAQHCVKATCRRWLHCASVSSPLPNHTVSRAPWPQYGPLISLSVRTARSRHQFVSLSDAINLLSRIVHICTSLVLAPCFISLHLFSQTPILFFTLVEHTNVGKTVFPFYYESLKRKWLEISTRMLILACGAQAPAGRHLTPSRRLPPPPRNTRYTPLLDPSQHKAND